MSPTGACNHMHTCKRKLRDRSEANNYCYCFPPSSVCRDHALRLQGMTPPPLRLLYLAVSLPARPVSRLWHTMTSRNEPISSMQLDNCRRAYLWRRLFGSGLRLRCDLSSGPRQDLDSSGPGRSLSSSLLRGSLLGRDLKKKPSSDTTPTAGGGHSMEFCYLPRHLCACRELSSSWQRRDICYLLRFLATRSLCVSQRALSRNQPQSRVQ